MSPIVEHTYNDSAVMKAALGPDVTVYLVVSIEGPDQPWDRMRVKVCDNCACLFAEPLADKHWQRCRGAG